MTIYFECTGCGRITAVEEPPAECGHCGHVDGITHLEKPGSAAAPDAASRAPASDPTTLRRTSVTDSGFNLMLSNPELLMLEERCIDGEARCEQRAEAARRRGDFAAAAFEAQLKEQYRRLRLRMRDRRDYDTRPENAPTSSPARPPRSAPGAHPSLLDED